MYNLAEQQSAVSLSEKKIFFKQIEKRAPRTPPRAGLSEVAALEQQCGDGVRQGLWGSAVQDAGHQPRGY